MTAPACESCGAKGAMDMRAGVVAHHKQGRRNQGAMTPLWAPAEYSESLGKVLCHGCFQREFYARPRAAA